MATSHGPIHLRHNPRHVVSRDCCNFRNGIAPHHCTRSSTSDLCRSPLVAAWVENDRLSSEITVFMQGHHSQVPPGLLGPTREPQNARTELKEQDNQEQQTTREFLGEWVRAVNRHGEVCAWGADVAESHRHPRHPSAAR